MKYNLKFICGSGLCLGTFLHDYFNTQYFNCCILKIICCQHLVKICFTECRFAVSKFNFYSQYVHSCVFILMIKDLEILPWGPPGFRWCRLVFNISVLHISCLVATQYFNINYQVLQVFKYLKLLAAFFHWILYVRCNDF